MRLGFFSLAAIVLFLISGTAMGLFTEMPRNLEIGETKEELKFTVYNESNLNQPLQVFYDLPGDFEIVSQPEMIMANSAAEVTALIVPDYSLEGTIHTATIAINLGGNTAEKQIELEYKKENKCPVDIYAQQSNDGTILVKAVNNSFKDKALRFKEITGTPDYNLEGPMTIALAGYEEKEFEYEITNTGNFKGNAELVFECRSTVLRTNVELDSGDDDNIAGFFTLTGLNLNSEIILNVFLGVIAAFLLIAFIARLVKVMKPAHEKKQNMEAFK